MAHSFSKTNTLGGLDQDSEVRNIDPYSYRYAKNIRNAINASGRGGTLTNVKGNTEITSYCLPYNNGVFPEGRNKVIGSVEDTKYATVIYFVWNSQGKHQILRYYRNETDPLNPYGKVKQIIQYDFGWTKKTRIESANIVYGTQEAGADSELTGDLLYWSDKKPRKINITKAQVCGKLKCWELIVPKTVGYFPATLLLTFKNFLGTTVDSINITMPPPPDIPPCVPVTINAQAAFLTPNNVFLDTVIPNMEVGSTFTIVGATDPANDQQYTVVSFTTSATGSNIFVQETVVFGVAQPVEITYTFCPPAQPDTRGQELFITTIADAINADTSLPVTATACACHLEICEKVSGTVWTIEADTDQVKIFAENWYGATIIEDFIDRCKKPPLNAPRGTYGEDLNVTNNNLPNYVQRKVFQFRLEYDYDDLERSALGVWSKISIDDLQCDGTSNPDFNFIDVDFNDDLLSVDTTLVLLKRVRFIVRQLNTGNDRAVIELKPCDFLDYDGTNWFCHFKFYNNIISNPIDAATAAKLFDNVPLESNDERFVKNRMVEGGILEGYDAPDCPKADYTINIEDSKNKLRHKVTGKIRILTYGLAKERASVGSQPVFESFYPTDSKYPFWKPPYVGNMQPPPNTFLSPYSGAPLLRGGIFNDTSGTAGAFFGGGSFSGAGNNSFGITTGMETDFDQRMGSSGWVVYAAGTPNYTISEQVNINCATDGVRGVLDTSSQLKVDRIGQYLYNPNDVPSDLYSTFELDLPDGVYVIRLASHWCSNDDVLDKGFAYDLKNGLLYQNTSTNVHAVIDNAGNWLFQKEITVTVAGGDVYIGEFIVMDVAPPIGYDSDSWQSICGYLYDDNGATNPNDADYAGVPVEKSIVFVGGYVWQSNGNPPFGAGTELGVLYSKASATDANGYFFQIGGQHVLPESPPQFPVGSNNMQIFATNAIGKIRSVDTVLGVGTLSNLLDKTLQIIDFNGNSVSYGTGTVFCIATTNNAISRQASRQISGHVKDQNGVGVFNVSAVYQEGRFTTTDADGFYTFLAWYDAVEANKAQFPNPALSGYALGYGRSIDRLIFNAASFCVVTYPNGQFLTFSATGTMPLPDFLINELANTLNLKTRKRGGKYIDGIRYYDSAGRLCSVAKLFEIYIPFETEDLSQYPRVVDSGGLPYPSGTYIGGVPIINWSLDPSFNPPIWASFYQFMRTKNLIYGRYLQWVANSVTYLSRVATAGTPEIVTSFQNSDAVAIKISISNIIDYSAVNNDSLVGYQYQSGDRMRLMYDRDITLIQGFNDFEVMSYDATTQEIIIKPSTYNQEILSGSVIEIMNPKSVETEDEQIFYEVGEVYKCTAPNTPNNQHGTTSGTFSNGDTYWRGRNILVNDTLFAQSVTVIVEDRSKSDFYLSDAEDIGRIGIIDPAFKQVYAPTKMRCSNPFLPSTAINGLSSFEELNQVELDRANGQIERLLQKENTVIAVTSLREISTYIEVVSFQQADVGSGVLAIANQYFGTQYPHSKRLGTDFKSSVVINDGIGFGYKSNQGETWRYQGDGEVTTSDAKMINYFYQLELDGVSDATAVYDRKHEEYILTLWRDTKVSGLIISMSRIGDVYTIKVATNIEPELYTNVTVTFLIDGVYKNYEGEVTIADGTTPTMQITTTDNLFIGAAGSVGVGIGLVFEIPETISWFNGQLVISGVALKDRWLTFYDFTPEKYEQIGSEIVSWKNGRLWLHDSNSLYNNFYGVSYKTQLTTVFNKEPDRLKVWGSCILKTLQSNFQNDWAAPLIENDNRQRSRLVKGSWTKKGEDYFAAFKRNLLDPTVNNPIVNGNALRSSTLTCHLENDYNGEMRLYAWDGRYTLSQYTIP